MDLVDYVFEILQKEMKKQFNDTRTKRGTNIQDITEFMGFTKKHIYPTPVYGDSQPCIDILQANTVTS